MLIALLPTRARADERRNVLLLTIAAPPEDSARLEAVARERLQPLDVQLEAQRVSSVDVAELRRPPPRACFARAWITLLGDGSARLYLEHGDRLLLRDVPGDRDNPELVREELGHILQAAGEGLEAGEAVGAPRQEVLQQVAPSPPPRSTRETPPASPAPGRRAALQAGARYEARWFGEGARFEDGPGLMLALTTRLGFDVSVHYRRPLRVERDPVGARFETVSVRALATLALLRQLRAGAGLGGDFVHVRPLTSSGDGFELTEAGVRKLVIGRVQVTYGYRAWDLLELQFSAGTDLDASGTRYVLVRETGDVSVLSPAALRPFVSLGAALP